MQLPGLYRFILAALMFSGVTTAFGQQLCVDSIIILGNKATRDKVVMRELSFREGECHETFEMQALLEESKENLMNTALFNFVEYETSGDSLITVTFRLNERWYLWASPVFLYEDRNFSSWLSKGDLRRTSYGFFISHFNILGNKQALILAWQTGFNKQALIYYNQPYLGKNKKLGFDVQGGLQSFHEAVYATINGKEAYLKDDRQLLYNRKFTALNVRFRPGIHGTFEASIGYESLLWSDTLISLNPALSLNSAASVSFIKVRGRVKIDHRDYASYPLKGWYADAEISKHGFGISGTEPDELQIDGGLRGYYMLFPRNYFAMSFQGRMSAAGPKPYYLNHALGYLRDFVRGYEYYIVDGQHFALFKSNLRYELLKPTPFRIPLMRNERFSKSFIAAYLNVHCDAAYVADLHLAEGNVLANQWLYGYGIGLDLLTYYDKVLRLEYSINGLNEKGFFIHFMASI